jgi:NAD+ diphosphatase
MLSSIENAELSYAAHSWLVFSGEKVMVSSVTKELPHGTFSRFKVLENYASDVHRLHHLDGQKLPYFVIDLGAEVPETDDFEFVSLRQIMMNTEHGAFDVIGRTWQYINFYRTHRYCGKCGSLTRKVSWETAVQCTRCEHRSYPRVSPCVIIAIYRDNEILLALSSRHVKTGMYSTIAGFVESGESLEEGVAREIYEEVGVKVTDVEYFDSQPWPFPHALMVGFLARWESGDIRPDDHEIADAKWFSVDELPLIPPKFSIAGQLIETVVHRAKSQKHQ